MRARLTTAIALCVAALAACGDDESQAPRAATATSAAAPAPTTSTPVERAPRSKDDDAKPGTSTATAPQPARPDPARAAAARAAAAGRAVRLVVRESLTTTDPGACTRLVTRRFTEQITGERGAAALSSCRRNSSDPGARTLELDRIAVRGATAEAEVRPRGGTLPFTTATLALVKAGGRWKVDRLRSATLDRPAFGQEIRRQFSGGTLPDGTAGCVVMDLAAFSNERIVRAYLEPDIRFFVVAVNACAVAQGLVDESGLSTSEAACVRAGVRRVLTTGDLGRRLKARPSDPGVLEAPSFRAAMRRLGRSCVRGRSGSTAP